MKDQLRLLRDCINNDRPAVVFQGDDFWAYQLESPATVELPKLSPMEMELVREEMNKR